MIQLFKNANFDFMGRRRFWIVISAVLVLCSIGVIAVRGINRGIEFTGGTELTVRFASKPDPALVRESLTKAGLPNHTVTTIGKAEENEIYIRVGLADSAGHEGQVAPQVLAALATEEIRAEKASGKFNLNEVDEPTLRARLETVPGLSAADAASVTSGILERRRSVALFRSVTDVGSVTGVTPEITKFLESRAFVGPFALRSISYIGPAVGKELLTKTFWAAALSLAGMLVYLGVRFQFQWGLAAVIALVHDTIITLGLFSLFGKEMSIPVVAAFLTLIGYSVNDTVVVFDRIRENLGKGTKDDFVTVINHALNQTLSRTVITSMLTWITVLALFLLGGEVLNPFAFVLVIGIVIGTYSSIYIASPYLVLVKAYSEKRVRGKAPARVAAKQAAAPPATKAVAKKVRGTGRS